MHGWPSAPDIAMNRLTKFFKSLRDLGIKKLSLFALYKLGVLSGFYEQAYPTRPRPKATGQPAIAPYPSFPTPTPKVKAQTLTRAADIQQGKTYLFHARTVPLIWEDSNLFHWSRHERSALTQDIKFIWEVGRFGWALTLARAYAFSGDAAFADSFRTLTLQFLDNNRPNRGWHWQSAQEVALRLMALIFCDRVFASSRVLTLQDRQRIWTAIAQHAERIPPTLIYARAQNNNHLLSEAAGLYAAGLYLPDHPRAKKWRRLGWRWLNRGLQQQIDENGTYIQHSVNYHRLMLGLALFIDHLRREAKAPDWPEKTRQRLRAATRWLWALTDPETGRVPNLGANDGAYIFALTSQPFEDYRPVLDAAAKAFLSQDLFNQPALSEIADWFGLAAPPAPTVPTPQAEDMLRLTGNAGRAFLRAAHFSDRPSHADQLHADLWWQGVNVALDPGTYQYNAPPPWDNALVTSRVHNTLTLNEEDQMQRAGRFLWLDWAQAHVVAKQRDEHGQLIQVTAAHNGYRRLNITHQRTLTVRDQGWDVRDQLLPTQTAPDAPLKVQMTWLLPDWEWEREGQNTLHLKGPSFNVTLTLDDVMDLNLFRAGERLMGTIPPQPIWGWHSPTYTLKCPALMVLGTAKAPPAFDLITTWRFDK